MTDELVKRLRAYTSGDNDAMALCDEAADAIDRLTAERDAARVVLSWAMDEIDVLSINATGGWAYPQGMGYLRRDEQADRYFAACKVRALSPSTLNKPE